MKGLTSSTTTPLYLFIPLLLMLALTSCGKQSYANNATFFSLSECMEGIKKSSGQNLKIIRDKPDIVSGKLSNGEHFSCKKVTSGTLGTHWKGWYMSK
ncbi:hypothetical protein QSV34_10670 [Porticoccus sp. W117]|uniref:hypothetical protein n=1 Tax=Porticoccus sp. W117 TaxID=3054777 RepID=UPI002597B1F9|nr:hypothetical protein [Porticoccus sp. W117]MDM3871814.1 hypothetical protein [Porticoccus sp. W117]